MMSDRDANEMHATDEFDSSFQVPLPPAEAWKVLLDIKRIAPCLPGVELTETVNERNYKGKISVPLGPVAFAFAGAAKFDEIDPVNQTAHVTAEGVDAEGRGFAVGGISFRLVPEGTGSKVLVRTDLALTGAVAEYGNNLGIICGAAERIIAKFADNLRTQLV